MGKPPKMVREALVANRQQISVEMSRLSVQAPRDNDGNGSGHSVIRFRKIDKLIEHLKGIQETQFTGYIKINFSQGNIGRIEKFEEILKS
jgi:hypothetical protein